MRAKRKLSSIIKKSFGDVYSPDTAAQAGRRAQDPAGKAPGKDNKTDLIGGNADRIPQ